MTRSAIGLDHLPELDFARYAPARRYDVVAAPKPATRPDDLVIVGDMLGKQLRLVWLCLRAAIQIILRRITLRLTAFFTRTLQSAYIAWAVAGCGWGGFIALPIILHFAR